MTDRQKLLSNHVNTTDEIDAESGGKVLPKVSGHASDDGKGTGWRKYKWWILAGVIAVIIAIILGVTLSKKDPTPTPTPTPDPGPTPVTPQGYNPYNFDAATIVNHESTLHGYLIANESEMVRLQHLHPLNDENIIKGEPKKVPTGPNNQMVKNVSFEFGQSDFRTAYLRLDDGKNSRYTPPSDMVSRPDAQWPMKLDQVGLSLSKDQFGFNFKDARTGKDYISTADSTFVMMDKYLQLDLFLPSRRIYGMGERNREFTLSEGTYTMWARDNNATYDDGRGGKQSYGVHPFALVQTATKGEFMGIYFRNSDAMSPIVRNYNDTQTILSLVSTGGQIEIYFFFKGTAKQIIAQYQNLVGKPALPPAWALGWHYTSATWKNATELQSFVSKMNASSIPFEGIWLSPDYMKDHQQFSVDSVNFPNLNDWVSSIHANGQKVVPVVAGGLSSVDATDKYYSAALQDNALIRSTENPSVEGGALTNSQWTNKTVYPDFFSSKAQDVWQQGLGDLQSKIAFDGVQLDMNTPQGKCNGECPAGDFSQKVSIGEPLENHGWWSSYTSQEDISTYEIPFIPGGKDNLDFMTNSLNATHPSNNMKEYDVHSLFGHAQGKATYEIMRASQSANLQDKLPFVLSQSTFPGSGKFVQHPLGKSYLTWDHLRYSIAGVMNFNMFGIPMAGPDACGSHGGDGDSRTAETDQICKVWFQLSAWMPLARINEADGNSASVRFPYNWDAASQNVIRDTVQERLSYTHLMYTCQFEAHDQGKTCFDPLLFHYPEQDEMFLSNQTESSFMVADSIMVSTPLQSQNGFQVYYPKDNGKWLNLRTTTESLDGGQWNTAGLQPLIMDVRLRPGRIIPYVNSSMNSYNTTQQVIESKLIDLQINRDNDGQAEGSIYLSDGISQSQLDNKEYEYYQFKLSGKSLKKWNKNEQRKNTMNKIRSITIFDASDLQNTQFACMRSESDYSSTNLLNDIHKDEVAKTLTITFTDAISFYDMKDIHFGTLDDIDLCTPSDNFLAFNGQPVISQDKKTYTLIGTAQTGPRIFDSITMTASFYNQGTAVNVRFEPTQQSQRDLIFAVPDEVLGFDRNARDEGVDQAPWKDLISVVDNKQIIIKNLAGQVVYQLNGIILGDHFTYFDADIFTDGKLMGLADQISDSLFLKDGVYSLWSKDIPSPVADQKFPGKNAYGVQPFVVSASGTTSTGLFANNAAAQDWWIKTNGTTNVNVKVFATGGIIDHFILGLDQSKTHGPVKVVSDYLKLFGKPAAPPQWALGWHQCRWGYSNVDKLREVLDMYKEEELPLDTIWNDIDYMNDYRSFTVGKEQGFADLGSFVQGLHNNSMHYIPILDAGIALRSNVSYSAYDKGKQQDMFIKSASGDDFVGMVWPNDAVWIDYFKSGAQALVRELMGDLWNEVNFDGIWLDMNEASNFCLGECYEDQKSMHPVQNSLQYIPTGRDLSEQSISLDAKHANGFTELDTHSLLGSMSAQAVSSWFSANNKRSMIIERSAYSGLSQHSSRWLGDNFSTQKFMGYSVIGVMQQSMNGYTLSGADVCGFMGDTNPELCARWYTVAAFQPFARNHNSWNTIPQEPYVFSKDIYQSTISYLDIIKHSMQQRLNMVRYMYSNIMQNQILFKTQPYYQPLFFQFPDDQAAYTADAQNNVMLGSNIKLSVLSNALGQDTTDFYFPAGTWCSMFQNIGDQACFTSTGQNKTFATKAYNFYVHLFENSIVPMQNVTNLKELYPETAFTTTADMQDQPVDFHILQNDAGSATGYYYNDDGTVVLSDTKNYFNWYQMNFTATSATEVVLDIAMLAITEQTQYADGHINSNDVLGAVHIYNAAAKGYSAHRYWQSEFEFTTGEKTKLLIAEYDTITNRLILPPCQAYLFEVAHIRLTAIV